MTDQHRDTVAVAGAFNRLALLIAEVVMEQNNPVTLGFH